MNWLTQMLHTEIDLRKMYPADISMPKEKSAGGVDNLIKSRRERSNQARDIILEALEDKTLTASEVKDRLYDKRESKIIRRLLRRMEKDGEVVSFDDDGNGKNIKWRRK